MERYTIFTKASVASAGAGALEADISSLGDNFDVRLKVWGLGAGKSAQIAIEDTVNNFTAAVTRWTKGFTGQVTTQAPIEIVIKSEDLKALRNGTGSAEMRINVVELSSTPGLVLEAWIIAPTGEVVVA